MKLNEVIGRLLKAKNIPKILKNHAKMVPCGKMGHLQELKEVKDNFRSSFD
jgi:hypothetical protein